MRVDRKYIVDFETLEQLLSQLGDDYLALEIDGERLQQYDSVYFDTPALRGYRHHLQGRRKRFKCRTRLYDAIDLLLRSQAEGQARRDRQAQAPALPLAHGSLTTEATAFLKRELLQEYGRAATGRLVPTLQTSFARLRSHTPAGRSASPSTSAW